MTAALLAAVAFAIIASALHLASIATAVWRCRQATHHIPAPAHAEAVSMVIPVCGLDNYAEDTLRSAFRLDYPRYELLFCAARTDDAALPVVRRLMAEHPWIDARILIGNERISENPKLNNVFKGWREARFDWIMMPDSNVLMPRDYLQRSLSHFTPDTGLVCSPPLGCLPDGFWAELECAFLNTYQARWQYFADAAGFGFAQGKTMLWRRDLIEKAGGVRALGLEAAEDAASTKIVRRLGLRVRLVEPPVRQPLGLRSMKDVWKRQRRWARLRRASFPLYFVPEILSGSLAPLAAVLFVARQFEVALLGAALLFAMAWYGAEMMLLVKTGWHVSRHSLTCAILRDLMLPVLYVNAWGGSRFEWRGHNMRAVEGTRWL
ncbi:MAG: ceramide glucosyltransferase [Pseudorhodoplanes sp.]|jgi:ceramide glucosyltransferase|nr:ceramide glucosyltransferase [Pseudorhodoplanes sp.]